MSGWKNKILTTEPPRPPRMLIYGQPGVGKSTFAAKLPKPIFIDLDRGIDQLRVDRLRTGNWNDTLELLRQIASDPGEYRSIAIDTIDLLEEAATVFVCERGNKQTLGDFGYGAGYEALGGEWRILLALLEEIQEKGLIICMLAHSVIRTARDPQIGEYDQYTTQLQKKTWSSTNRWCDFVGFACFDGAKQEDERRLIVSGKRILLTTKGTGYEAKNRFGLPVKMPLDWDAVKIGIKAGQQSIDEVKTRILAMAKGTEYEEKAASYITEANEDVRRLLQLESALKAKIEEVKT